MDPRYFLLSVAFLVAVQLFSAAGMTAKCGGKWYSHPCSRWTDWENCGTQGLKITVGQENLYQGERTKLKATYYSDQPDYAFTYLFCYKRFLSSYGPFYYEVGCVETDEEVAFAKWNLSFSGNATVLASVYQYDNILDFVPTACAAIEVTVGTKAVLDISVSVTEDSSGQYAHFFPDSITWFIAADIPNETNSLSRSNAIRYEYTVVLYDDTKSISRLHSLASNQSNANVTHKFNDTGVFIYDVSVTANDSANHVFYTSESLFGDVDVIEKAVFPIDMTVTEDGHDDRYSHYFPGNISWSISTNISNLSSHTNDSSGDTVVYYEYNLVLYKAVIDTCIPDSNVSHHYTSNDSYLDVQHNFKTIGRYGYNLSATAHDITNRILYTYSSGKHCGIIRVIEQVKNPAFTVNSNQTLSPNSSVDVVITVNGSLPIHVCWNLTVSMPSTNTTPSGTPSSKLHPLLASGYQYRCNYTTNCVTFNTTHRFVFNCTFNHTGDYQIKASFYNSASSGNILYKFTVAKPHIPPVVAMSTSAVVAIILIVSLIVGSVVIISLYISYRRYRNRFTETANFSFVRLNSPSKWEKFKFQVNHLKDRMMRRSSRVGLVNVNDDTRSSVQYGSTNLGRFDSQGSL